MIKDVAFRVSRQIEIAVISKVENSFLISRGLVINLYFIVVGERVSYRYLKVARISLFHILAEISKF